MQSQQEDGKLLLGRALLAVPLAAVAVVLHLRTGFALRILGSFCGLLSLALLGSLLARAYPFARGTVLLRGRELDLEALARRLLPALLVVGVATLILAPLLAGQMPLSHDHPVHLYKAWHFWDRMLLEGRLRGWSSFWFFGYPAEELYPIGPDLWVALFRLLTAGLLSWEATYGLAFVGVFAFAAYAVYAFGRSHFGPLAGVVAGLAWVLDAGDYREGGWSYTVDWAVWVQVLAMALLLLGFCRLKVVLERGRARDVAWAALTFGAALLSHQMNFMLLGLGLPLYLLAHALASAQPVGRVVARAGLVLGLGACLAGFWLFPMMLRSEWTTSIGDLWRPFGATVRGLVDGTVFANVWPVVVLLGLVGAGLGIATRNAAAVFLVLLAALLLLLSSSTAFEELNLMALSKSFSRIQYQRFIIPAKACVYLLAGYLVLELAHRARAVREACAAPASDPASDSDSVSGSGSNPSSDPDPVIDPRRSAPREFPSPGAHAPSPTPSPYRELLSRAGLVALIALLLAPFARPLVEGVVQNYLRTVGGLVVKRQVAVWDDYQEFLRWSAQKRATSEGFYRISYELDRHSHLMMGAPVFNKTPYYKVGYTPARLFKHVTETTEDPLYRALSVAYVVSQGPLSRPSLEEETRIGSLTVYRFKGYRPQRYTLTGPGSVEVKTFDEERIHLRLRGTGAGSRLKVHVSNYARWRARMNGEVVPITEAPAYGTTYPMLMEVPVKDGDLVFDYVLRGPDWLGTLASLLGIAGVALLFLAERRSRIALVLERRFQVARLWGLVERTAGWAVLVVAVAGALAIAHRVTRPSSGLEESSLASLLDSASVTQAGRVCNDRRRSSAGTAWYCSPRSWNYVGPTTNKFNGAFLPCIWAHPTEEGPLVISFPRVRLGRAIAGSHGLADGAVEGFPQGAPVTLEISADGQRLDQLIRPNEKGWVGFRVNTSELAGREVNLSLSVATSNAGGRHYCFDARIVK
jgi:hypothetical protein